jgi:hypothetical protein
VWADDDDFWCYPMGVLKAEQLPPITASIKTGIFPF